MTTIAGGVAKADIALPSSFLGSDPGERVAFTAIAGGSSGGGVGRVVDSYLVQFMTWNSGDEGQCGSIAYNSDQLVVGDYVESQVYACADPWATYPKFTRLNSLKQPGGPTTGAKVVVAWSGDKAVAGTSGDESAFSVSTDDGYAFNDISMIDTAITTLNDVAVSADGTMLYVASYDTTDTGTNDVSIWLKGSSWMRVYKALDIATAKAAYIIRVAPEDGSVVYLSSKTTTDMWLSKDAGKTLWKKIPSYKLGLVQDFYVVSADVVYAIDADECSKTINGGASWATQKSLDGLTAAKTVIVADNGDILVGGTGKVAFSKDGGSTFTRILDTTDADPVHIVPHPDYADNNKIYIAAGDEIERGKADKHTTWSSKEPTSGDMDIPSDYDAYGIAQHNGWVYVLTGNSSNSRIYRALNLETGATADLCNWSYSSTVIAGYSLYTMQATPKALKQYKGANFWAVATGGLYSNQIVGYSDAGTTGPTLKSPDEGETIAVNPVNGRAYNVPFTWEKYPLSWITECQLQICTDAAFEDEVYNKTFTVDSNTITKVIGPLGATNQIVEFMPGMTYYWRVRVSNTSYGPWVGPWSASSTFKVAPLVEFGIVSPTVGATGTPVSPMFSWTEFEGAIGYEIMVAEDSTFKIIDFSHTVDRTFYQAEETLAYDTTYYWRVRGVTGPAKPKQAAPGGPWAEGMFRTEAKPVEPTPPVVIEPTPPTKVEVVKVPVEKVVPQAIPNYLLWTIIGVGAILVISLIVLIVRTRRVA
jgi:hypothetical protein